MNASGEGRREGERCWARKGGKEGGVWREGGKEGEMSLETRGKEISFVTLPRCKG